MTMRPLPPLPRGPADEPGRRVRDEVTIGILAALPVEGAAMASLIDDARLFSFSEDPHDYRVGSLPSNDPGRPHRVAMAVLSRDGTRHAAATCADLLRTFPYVRCVVMIGIAGGIPSVAEPDKCGSATWWWPPRSSTTAPTGRSRADAAPAARPRG